MIETPPEDLQIEMQAAIDALLDKNNGYYRKRFTGTKACECYYSSTLVHSNEKFVPYKKWFTNRFRQTIGRPDRYVAPDYK